nr:PhoP/PhoQ regulator MgrB [Providencia vermicola]
MITCIFLYLLAMDSLCDQGGENFIYGICGVTDWLPFWIYSFMRHNVLLLQFLSRNLNI